MIINPYIYGGFTNTYSFLFDGVNEDLRDTSTSTEINFEYTEAFSYSFWVYHSALGSAETYISRPNSAFNGSRVQISKNASDALVFRIGLTSGTTDRIQLTTTNTLSATTWYHIVCVNDGTNTTSAITIYRNASNQTGTAAGGVVSTSIDYDRLLISGVFGGGTQKMNGYIDEVSIWNKALSGAEITELYNSGEPNNLLTHSANANLVGWWSDESTWDGSNHTWVDKILSNDLLSANMEEADKTTTVP